MIQKGGSREILLSFPVLLNLKAKIFVAINTSPITHIPYRLSFRKWTETTLDFRLAYLFHQHFPIEISKAYEDYLRTIFPHTARHQPFHYHCIKYTDHARTPGISASKGYSRIPLCYIKP
jgi:hypothetical protein